MRQYPPWLLFATFVDFVGYPRYNPQKTTQTMMHARSMITLVVRVISRSKNNFYDVIRLKIIESRYFPKETVKVGLEKIKQNGGRLKATKCPNYLFPHLKSPTFRRFHSSAILIAFLQTNLDHFFWKIPTFYYF